MNSRTGIRKIVSGGQTGVDRGALDAAIALGIPHGGWCPQRRIAEDGRIDDKYQLTELPAGDYAARTQQNVVDSDGTLILYHPPLRGGTLLTHRLAKQHGKPLLRIRLDRPIQYARIVNWIQDRQIQILNVAGPRGSSHPHLQETACRIVTKLLQQLGGLPLTE